MAAASLLAYHDAASRPHRFAAFDGERLIGAIFISRAPLALGRTFLAEGLAGARRRAADRLRLLAGRPGAAGPDPGATVCSCFASASTRSSAPWPAAAASSVEAVGALLQAGTNCGSCRPEIRKIIDERAARDAPPVFADVRNTGT